MSHFEKIAHLLSAALFFASFEAQAAQKDFTEQPLVTSDPIPRASAAPAATPTAPESNKPAPVYLPSVSTENARSGESAPAASPRSVTNLTATSPSSGTSEVEQARPALNDVVLRAIDKMPQAGGYSVSAKAAANLRKSVSLSDSGLLKIRPEIAKPSFCSGATYLLFLKVIQDLEDSGALKLDKAANAALLHKSQPDGVAFWGRWNANGPGVARLFYELNAGENFTDIAKAKPGDFLKIWWTDEIGSKEKGHLVVYLGRRKDEAGEESLRFWSSNIPDGYGAKEVPMSKAKRLLFSRFTRPQALQDVALLPPKDEFLANMLTKSFSMKEVLDMTGAK